MQSTKDLAIILRSVPFEERNRIVTALTENHGLVTAFAKNCIQSRRFGGTLEIFTASEWMFQTKPGSDLLLLTEAHAKEHFPLIRRDFEKLALGSVFNELILKLVPAHQVCTDLFRLHSNALVALSNCQSHEKVFLLNAYIAKLLQWSGNQPRIQNCLVCAEHLTAFLPHEQFSCLVTDGGWLCPQCRATGTRHIQSAEGQTMHQRLLKVSARAVQDFEILMTIPIRKIQESTKASEKEHRELFLFLEGLLMYHLPGFDKHPLKSLRFTGIQSNLLQPKENRL